MVSESSGSREKGCPKTYYVRYIPGANIDVDGKLNESEWQKAHLETGFQFPWEHKSPPLTEFRSLCDEKHLYFGFNVWDENLVIEESSNDVSAVEREDRVELFFACDKELKRYFCIEIDPLGRVLSYSATHYRKFDYSWKMKGIAVAASTTRDGYAVEGAVPLKTLQTLGLRFDHYRQTLITGVFRAEFNRCANSRIDMRWISWVDPGTEDPDFHVPGAFGCFRLEKE